MGFCRKIIVGLLFFLPGLAFAQAAGVAVDVTLSPAGSFRAETSNVKGFAYKTADGIAAENVEIDVRTLKTGVSLRDKHTKEHLMAEKFPEAKLIKAIGKGGKGSAIVEIKGVKKKVSGTYTVAGNMLKAQFPINLSDLDIKGIRYMGIGVKDQVVINVNLPIQAARATASVKKK
jgi:hypothetical protein